MKVIREVTESLKPCPFCGGSVKLESAMGGYEEMHGQRRWWGVKCRNTLNLGGTCAIEQIPSASKEAAIARWNTRYLFAESEVQTNAATHCKHGEWKAECLLCFDEALDAASKGAGE